MSPMQRHLYPPNWEEIATAVKEAAGWRCQTCGRQCRRPGEPFDSHRRTLTVAHWPDPDPMNCSRDNLLALCPACHNRLDAPIRRQHAAQTRRESLERAGQLPLEGF